MCLCVCDLGLDASLLPQTAPCFTLHKHLPPRADVPLLSYLHTHAHMHTIGGEVQKDFGIFSLLLSSTHLIWMLYLLVTVTKCSFNTQLGSHETRRQ